MKLSEINEYIQTGAAIIAIVGIFLLGYEVRQSNELATQQAQSQSWSNWIAWQQSIIESDIASVIARSNAEPESLSGADKEKLHNFYLGFLYPYESDLDVFSYTSKSVVEEVTEEAVDTLSSIFSYPYARAWYEETGYSGDSGLRERVLRSLDRIPIDYREKLFARIDARVAKTKGQRRAED